MTRPLITFIKARRRALGLTQRELADRAGVGLRFIRELEQGKTSLRLDKVDQVLALFGHRMEPSAFRMEIDDEES
ncbi:MAG: helix-turn-helix transcriptional regulator [Verrucomicrobia bacterium]|nr:helix-turn-helix transcriptional regulator [Verrucomicrobiota bacterium]